MLEPFQLFSTSTSRVVTVVMAESAATFGTVTAALSLADMTLGKLTELANLVRAYKQLHKNMNTAVENTQKVIATLTNLQNDGRAAASIGSHNIERESRSLLEINMKLGKVVERCNESCFSGKAV